MSISGSNLLRFSGLASGLDTEAIIEKMMQARRIPVDQMVQKRALVEWKRDMFRDINTSLAALKDLAFNMKLSSSFTLYDVGSTDSTIATATWADGIKEGSYSLVVDQLATAAYKKSAAEVSLPLESSAAVVDYNVSGKDFKLTFNGVRKTITWSASEGAYADMASLVAGLQAKINDAFGQNQITVSDNAGKLDFSAARSDFQQLIILNNGETDNALIQFNISDGVRSQVNLDTKLEDISFNVAGLSTGLTFDGSDKFNFTINGVSFSIDKTNTFNDLISEVNANSSANVKLEFDTTTDKFILVRSDSGAGKNVSISDGTGGNLTTILQLGAQIDGQNSVVDFTANGVTTSNIENSANNFNISGLNVSLLKAASTETVTLTATKDVDAIYDKIKSFVDKYNEVITMIGTKLSEERDSDYLPLTDEQKKEMKDSDIELWEGKAKSGILNNEVILRSIYSNLRQSITSKVNTLNASSDEFYEIGIKTSTSYSEYGKLLIDETKLREAIKSNLDNVVKVFNNSPTALQGTALSGVVDVNGKDFYLTHGASQENITLSGSYDLSTAQGKSDFRSQVQTQVDEKFGAGSITVTFGSNMKLLFTSKYGQTLKLNSGTLDAVTTLGFSDGDTYDSEAKGIASKLYDLSRIGMNDIVGKAGSMTAIVDSSALGEEMERIQDRIDVMNERLVVLEKRYYKQFTALETAINEMNAQSSWLSQQMGGTSQ